VKRQSTERSLKQLPGIMIPAFALVFVLQLTQHFFSTSSMQRSFEQLPQPYSKDLYAAASKGSEKLWSYLMLLKVQLHDNQRGRHESYRHLDYKILSDWLLTLSHLNPDSDYPAFLASRVYSQIHDKAKIRIMIGVIKKLFEENPALHWRRMTEACLLAKHQLNDLPLALSLAEEVAKLPPSIELPYWARDMKLILLDELNQLQSAQILISSMLQSGSITDNDELRFLKSRLLKIQQQMSAAGHSAGK
jgi:hypothetical protein